jgi:hypothetical protein
MSSKIPFHKPMTGQESAGWCVANVSRALSAASWKKWRVVNWLSGVPVKGAAGGSTASVRKLPIDDCNRDSTSDCSSDRTAARVGSASKEGTRKKTTMRVRDFDIVCRPILYRVVYLVIVTSSLRFRLDFDDPKGLEGLWVQKST